MKEFRPVLASHLRYWECCIAAGAAKDQLQQAEIWTNWSGPDPLMHPSPQCGYWKTRWTVAGVKLWRPVAIWLEAGAMKASVGTLRSSFISTDQAEIGRIWNRCGSNPISYPDYLFAHEHGRFPGEVDEAVPALDNYASDPGARLRDGIAELIGRIELFIRRSGDTITEEIAISLANYMEMIRTAEQTASAALADEIAEHKAEIARRKSTWEISLSAAGEMTKRLRELLTPFLRARKAAGLAPKLGGQHGNRISLRPVWKAHVLDWDKAMKHYHDNPAVRDLIQKLLDANARSKNRDQLAVDGVLYYEEDIAA